MTKYVTLRRSDLTNDICQIGSLDRAIERLKISTMIEKNSIIVEIRRETDSVSHSGTP